MLPDDIVLRNAHYWAKRLVTKYVDYNELVSIGYLVGKPLRDKRLLKDWIHFTLLNFIISEQKALQHSNEYILNTQYAQAHTTYHDLYTAIKKAKLSKREMRSVKMYFFLNMTQKEIGGQLGVKQQTVQKFLKRAVDKIKKQYIKDDKNE